MNDESRQKTTTSRIKNIRMGDCGWIFDWYSKFWARLQPDRSTKLRHVSRNDWTRRGDVWKTLQTGPVGQDDERRLEDKVSWVEVSHNTHKVPNEWLVIMTPLIPRNQLSLSLSLASPLPPSSPHHNISRGDPRTKQSRLLRLRPPPVDPNTLEEDLITTSPFEREIWFSLV